MRKVQKRIYNVIFLLFMSFIMTGCVKFNASMNIQKDKSMNFEIIYAVDMTYFDEGDSSFEDEELEQLREKGFIVTDYSDGNMEGVKLTRDIDNIDLVSSTGDAKYSLSGIMNNEDNNYLFKVKKGLFKNRYIAKFEFDFSDSSLDDSNSLNEDFDTENVIGNITDESNAIENDDTNLDGDVTNNEEDDMDLGMDFDPSLMMSLLDLSFSVNLPYAAISNNASNVSNEGKMLKWSLTTSGTNEYIEFEFELYNMVTIYVGIGIILILIVVIVFFVVKKFGKKKNNDSEVNNSIVSNDKLSSSDNIQNTGFVLDQMAISNQFEMQNDNSILNQQSINMDRVMPVDNNMQNNVSMGQVPSSGNVDVVSGNNVSIPNSLEVKQVVSQDIPVSNQMGVQNNNVLNQEQVLPSVLDMKPDMSVVSSQQNNVSTGQMVVPNNVDMVSGNDMNIPNVLEVKQVVSQEMPVPNQMGVQNNNVLNQQQIVPSVLDMKPDMSVVSSQQSNVSTEQNIMQTNNLVNNNIQNTGQVQSANSVNQVKNNSQIMQQNISGMNFMNGPIDGDTK